MALRAIRLIRGVFDLATRYNKEYMNEHQWLNRTVFLETIAGVPGMVGGMFRHMRSLRTLKHDYGIIHHLLEEAENERTHLFIFLKLRQPGRFFQLMVAIAQGIFFNFYFFAYLLSPTFCHRFVGYLEEEAVHTYTVLLKQLDDNKLQAWTDMPAPEIAREYYELPKDAKLRDVVLSVRADETIHRDCNHKFAELKPETDVNQEILNIYSEEIKEPKDKEGTSKDSASHLG